MALLMSTHYTICFHGEIRKKNMWIPLLSEALGYVAQESKQEVKKMYVAGLSGSVG